MISRKTLSPRRSRSSPRRGLGRLPSTRDVRTAPCSCTCSIHRHLFVVPSWSLGGTASVVVFPCRGTLDRLLAGLQRRSSGSTPSLGTQLVVSLLFSYSPPRTVDIHPRDQYPAEEPLIMRSRTLHLVFDQRLGEARWSSAWLTQLAPSPDFGARSACLAPLSSQTAAKTPMLLPLFFLLSLVVAAPHPFPRRSHPAAILDDFTQLPITTPPRFHSWLPNVAVEPATPPTEIALKGSAARNPLSEFAVPTSNLIPADPNTGSN